MSNQVKAQGYEGIILRVMIVIIFVGGGLFGCNWWIMMTTNLGFDPQGVVDGKLTECSGFSPCIASTMPTDSSQYIAPIPLTVTSNVAIAILERVLPRLPNADIREHDDTYFAVLIGSVWRETGSILEVYVDVQTATIQIKIEAMGSNTDSMWLQERGEQLIQLYTQENE